MEMIEEEVVVVGAGVAGLATALALKRVGIQALVLERSDGLRATGAALSLTPNAWLALEALGVAHKLTSIYPLITKGYITNVANGAVQEVSLMVQTRDHTTDVGTGAGQEVSDTGTHTKYNGIRTIHRKALLEALAEELPVDSIRFSSKLTSIETIAQEGSSIAIIRLEDSTIIKAKVLIGCDGLHSKVASWLDLRPPAHAGRWVVRGIAVYPQGHGLNHEVNQFVDIGKRAGFVPLTDKDVFWFMGCELSSQGEGIERDPKLIQKSVLETFAKDFPPLYIDVVRHSDLSTVTWAPIMFRYPWDLIFGKLNKGNITVVGDAMHPMTPDLAQGATTALEDAVVLGRQIGKLFVQHGKLVPEEVAGGLTQYVKERKWRLAKLITCSYAAGWAQQSGSGWIMKFIRDVVFFRLLFKWTLEVTRYDCGKLPIVPATDPNDLSKNKME